MYVCYTTICEIISAHYTILKIIANKKKIRFIMKRVFKRIPAYVILIAHSIRVYAYSTQNPAFMKLNFFTYFI